MDISPSYFGHSSNASQSLDNCRAKFARNPSVGEHEQTNTNNNQL